MRPMLHTPFRLMCCVCDIACVVWKGVGNQTQQDQCVTVRAAAGDSARPGGSGSGGGGSGSPTRAGAREAQETRQFSDAIQLTLQTQSTPQFQEEALEKTMSHFLDSFEKVVLENGDKLASDVMRFIDAAQVDRIISNSAVISGKIADLAIVVDLSPIAAVMDAFAKVEQRSAMRIYRLMDGTKAGIVLKERARLVCEGLRHDRSLVAGLDAAMSMKDKLKLASAEVTGLTPQALQGMLPAAFEACTSLYCARQNTRKEFKQRFGPSLETCIVEFAAFWRSWCKDLSQKQFVTVVMVIQDLPNMSIRDLHLRHFAAMKDLKLGADIMVQIHTHSAVRSVKSIAMSLQSSAPDWAEEDSSKVASWLQWWATALCSILGLAHCMSTTAMQGKSFADLSESEPEAGGVVGNFRERCTAIIRDSACLPKDLTVFTSHWPWPAVVDGAGAGAQAAAAEPDCMKIPVALLQKDEEENGDKFDNGLAVARSRNQTLEARDSD